MKISLRFRYLLYIFLSFLLTLTIWQGKVFAQSLAGDGSNIDVLLLNIWMLISGFLVFFMNAGFAMVEAGFCRKNNAINILAKNLIVFCISALAYWILGFGLMFGNTTVIENSLWGQQGFCFDIFTDNNSFSQLLETWSGRDLPTLFFFQLTFAGTAATIVSGAVAERIRFWAFLLFSFCLVGVIYPIVGHWIWSSEGWLYNLLKFRDFAGSTVVHSVGGMAGLVGAWLLKPRHGRFGYNSKNDTLQDEETQDFTPHDLGFATLGCLILWLGWFGFNGGSVASLTSIPTVIVTTMIAAASGGFIALIFSPAMGSKVSLSSIINGILGGLVGITASSAYVDIKSAIFIGGVSGIFVSLGEVLLKQLKIDDPVGAIPVHLFGGFWGTIAVGLFSNPNSQEFTAGLIQNSLISQTVFQLLGWGIVMFFTAFASLFFWLLIGFILQWWEQVTFGTKNKKKSSHSSSSRNEQRPNLIVLVQQFWVRSRKGIRVKLSDELNGSDGVFKNSSLIINSLDDLNL
ncbi:ammonium transporter [Crocosphaera sp.]|uniref:ammonium transporter n=1 Tax=Crocosphaera sp. TaxID=2729996 RepID=UPI003F258E8F|nr:ammonium transporter [Crocosphaera sp.]